MRGASLVLLMVFDLLLLMAAAVCAVASRYGAAPERVLCTAFLADLLLERWFAVAIGGEFATEYDQIYLALEFGLLVAVLMVALRANRVYPLWFGGAQIVAVTAHVMLQVLGERARPACELMDQCAAAMAMIVLVVGLCRHLQRRQRLGRSYPDWTV